MNTQTGLRAVILAGAIAAALFWVYGIYFLMANASPTGDGMELVTIVPMTVILAALTVPALLLARGGRHQIWAAGFLAVSILANYFLWRQILIDLAPG
jgi:hypothetical protein